MSPPSDFPTPAQPSPFPKRSQRRGRRLWQYDAVTIEDVDFDGDLLIVGEVDDDLSPGHWPCLVEVEVRGGDDVLVDCTCGQAYCEHGIALLFAFDEMREEDTHLEDVHLEDVHIEDVHIEDVHIEDVHPEDVHPEDTDPRSPLPPSPPQRHRTPDWRSRLVSVYSRTERLLAETADELAGPDATPATEPTEIHYVLGIDECRAADGMFVVALQPETVDGAPMLSTFPADRPPRHLSAADRQALLLLRNVGRGRHGADGRSAYTVPADLVDLALSLMFAHGRVFRAASFRERHLATTPLIRDPGEPLRCVTIAERSDDAFAIRGELRRGDESITADALLGGGYAIAGDRIVRVSIGAAFDLMRALIHDGPLRAPAAHASDLITEVMTIAATDPHLTPPVMLQTATTPVPVLVVDLRHAMARHVPCELLFDYGGRLVEIDDSPVLAPLDDDGPWLARDENTELRLLEAFERAHEARLEPTGMPTCFLLQKKALYRDLTAIVATGQRVLADGKPMLPSTAFHVSVRTGIDWFDVRGEVAFADGARLPLAKVLLAARRGERLVALGDGRTGVLPEDLIERWAPVLELGEQHDDGVRLQRGQALLLDALLAARATEVDADGDYRDWLRRLGDFAGIAPRAEPAAFRGTLRDYQRDGLGWLWFLRDVGLGGCLADDMGLGKTVQVLALLLEVHRRHDRPPSLLVVPRSVLDNWQQEARRFTPDLRVLDFSGPNRWQIGPDRFAAHDVVLTTYGTLRGDVARFDQDRTAFEYAILDEAQAVENATSVTSKAVRLVRARHRLALTGTPVQNHIGELWALFEFLSPGLLGKSQTFQRIIGNAKGRKIGVDLDVLHRALAPFLLRRTKDQVLRELPAKQEQTIQCDLDAGQRRAYEALRAHYRERLLHGGAALDNAERFVALEALLRLRQAACHEGLIDPKRADRPSAKLDVLIPMLAEIAESGHKALVFSQFTSFLAIVRKHLDARGIAYEYLDGGTRKRQPRVDRFQQDPACSAFLISLKAGGFGLNLTAADYVFLIDPWWNPAAEAQAIDRAHRIGQTQKVTAYRLVARDTVEEKVLQLQREKRALADAVLGDNASLLKDLDREQLAELLG